MSVNLDPKLIQRIQEIGRGYALERIVLFGSRARGDNRNTSDIDLAVFPLQDFHRKGHLTSDLEDLETLLKIDLILIDEFSDTNLLENIKKEGVTLYERAPKEAN